MYLIFKIIITLFNIFLILIIGYELFISNFNISNDIFNKIIFAFIMHIIIEIDDIKENMKI